MANPLQQLQALVGGAPMTSGMAATGPSDMVSETPSIIQQLQQLLGGGGGGGGMPPAAPAAPTRGPMLAALQDRMAAQGMPRAPGPDGRDMLFGTTTGPGTDSDYYEMHEANQGVRGNLPPQPQRDYSGYGEEMEPLDDPRQTPLPEEPPEAYKPNVGAPGAPGQSIMGSYLKSQAAARDGTQAEIDDISKRMGSGDPSADGNFPSQKEIDDLNAGRISPVLFDKKWGKGAAAEMQESSKPADDDDDDGDHEYR